MLWRSLLVYLLMIPAISTATRGCTCSDVPPGKCPDLQADDVVFLGTVTTVEDIAYAAPSASDQPADASATKQTPVDIVAARLTRYHFRIDERFAPAAATA